LHSGIVPEGGSQSIHRAGNEQERTVPRAHGEDWEQQENPDPSHGSDEANFPVVNVEQVDGGRERSKVQEDKTVPSVVEDEDDEY
jgi:hypothetical protein